MSIKGIAISSLGFLALGVINCQPVVAQDMLPTDNGLVTYHVPPRYRASEEHPLRIISYVVHPIGWLAREVITRPISYIASSTEFTRSFFGFREPHDYRSPECFSSDDGIPDCRAIAPFNYGTHESGEEDVSDNAPVDSTASLDRSVRAVYFPDVNFDFNKRQLSDLGRGQVHRIAKAIQESPDLKIVLQGHADYKGTDQYNEKLGMDRSDAVRKELVALGVPADRLATVTFGESDPIFKDEQDWARAVNRRVSVQVQEEEVKAPSPVAANTSSENSASGSWQPAQE